jgi:hypothetical protein
VRDGRLQNGLCTVNPDDIEIEMARQRHQPFGEVLTDAHLWDLAQKDVAGVDVEHQRRALQMAHHGFGDALRQHAFTMTGEGPIQVDLEDRNRALQSVQPKRIDGGIQLDSPTQCSRMGDVQAFQPLGNTMAQIESFELVAVDAADHCHGRAVTAVEDGAPELQAFSIRQLQGQNGIARDVHQMKIPSRDSRAVRYCWRCRRTAIRGASLSP